MEPLFNRLGNMEFLDSCKLAKMQNLNESYHHVIWGSAPKGEYNSALETKVAVAIGTLFFNKGRGKTLHEIHLAFRHRVTNNMIRQWDKNRFERYNKQQCQEQSPVLRGGSKTADPRRRSVPFYGRGYEGHCTTMA